MEPFRPFGAKSPLWITELSLIVIAGVAYPLAFANNDIWPLAFVALAPFALAIRGKSPRRAAILGLLMGLIVMMIGFSWLLDMLRTFSGFPVALCLLFMSVISAFQGGRYALMGWLYARAVARGRRWDLTFALTFAASEFVYPMLFPSYYGACVHKVPILAQAADLGGPILVGVILAFANTACVEVVSALSEKRALSRAVVFTGVGVNLANLLYGAVRIRMVDAHAAASEHLKVGFVQGNMGLMQKRENPAEGLRRHERMTKELREQGVDLVVWSESSVTMPMAEDNFATRYRQQLTGRIGVPLLFGSVIYTRSKPERWFNTAIVSNEKGEIDPKRGRYDKQFLLAFGEYLPFGDRFPILYEWSPNSGRFSPGSINEPLRVEIKGKERSITTLVCYEDILPAFTNKLVRHANPDFLVNITNDAWFGDTAEPWQHLSLAKFRSIEHRRYLVRSTNSGVSAIIDPVGRTLVQSKTFVAEKGFAEIRAMKSTTGYEIWGDAPWYLSALGAIFLAFWPRLKKAKPEPQNADAAAPSVENS